MTDRIAGFIVTLETPTRDDDAEATLNALRMVRGVLSVKPVVSDANTFMAWERAVALLNKATMPPDSNLGPLDEQKVRLWLGKRLCKATDEVWNKLDHPLQEKMSEPVADLAAAICLTFGSPRPTTDTARSEEPTL